MQNLRLRGRPSNHFRTDSFRPMNALQLCRWQFSHKKTLQQTFLKQILDVFEPVGFEGQRTMFILGSLESVYGLPISVNWTFLARCYDWATIRANRSNIGDFAPTRSVCSNISGMGSPSPIIFARIVRPLNVLQICRWQFSHKLCSRLSSSKVRFWTESAVLRFWVPYTADAIRANIGSKSAISL